MDLTRKIVVTSDRDIEKQLIARARTGDRAAVRKLVDNHKDRLYAFIWRVARHHHDAEEICQDAFLKAFASLDSFSTQYRFSTWLFTIAYRVCLNHMRRRKAVTGDVDFSTMAYDEGHAEPDAFESDEANRVRQMVWSSVDLLSEPQRATLLLFYRQEFSCQEIARVLGVPVATVKSHLHRGRARLRELLESVSEKQLLEFRNRSASAG